MQAMLRSGTHSAGRGLRVAIPLAALLALVLSGGTRIAAQPSSTPILDWLFDGRVDTTARVGDTLFVGGAFTAIAPDSARVGNLVTVSATTGAIVTTYPRFDGALVSLPDSAGGLYALIDVHVNGTFVRDIVHVRADGSRDPAFTFGAAVASNGYPRMLVVGTRLIATGGVQVGGVDRLMVAVDLVTGALSPWTPSLPANSFVMDMTSSSTQLFVISYLYAGGRDVRAFDIASGALVWQQALPGQQTLAPAGAMTLAGSRLLVGIERVYALDAGTGVTDATWGGADDAPIWGVAASSTTVYVNGLFTTFRGQPRNSLAALDLATGALLPWDPQAARRPLSISVSPTGTVFVNFDMGPMAIGGQLRSSPVELDTNGVVTPWAPAIAGSIGDALPSGEMLFGRDSLTALTPRIGMAAFDVATGGLSSIAPVLGGQLPSVNHIVTDGQRVFFRGSFSTVNGQPRNGVAAIDGTTGALLEWPAPGVTFYLDAAEGPWLYGATSSGLRRVSVTTGVFDPTWTPPVNATVLAVGGELWVSFGLPIGPGAPRGGSAFGRVDRVTGAYRELYRNTQAPGSLMTVDGDTLYVRSMVLGAGPGFPELGSEIHARDTVTGLPVSRPPLAGRILSLTNAGGRLVVGGEWMTLGTRQLYGAVELARPDAITTWDSGFRPYPHTPGLGSTMTWAHGNALVAAGDIGSLSGGGASNPYSRLAVFPLTGVSAPSNLRAQSAGPNTMFTWDAMVPPPSGGYVIEGGFAAGQIAGALALGNATSVALPMPAGPLFIRVRPQGSTEVSNEIVAGCFASPLPPTALTTTLAGTTLSLAWTAPTAAVTNYTLLAGTAAGLSNVVTLPLGAQTSVNGTVPGGTFFARITATNACGTSGPSGEVFFTIGAPDPLPAAPTNLAASVSGSTVSLTWTAPSWPVTGYVLEAGTGAGLANIGAAQMGAATSFAISGVPRGTYVLRVRAVTSAGSGAPSADVVVTVP